LKDLAPEPVRSSMDPLSLDSADFSDADEAPLN